MRQWDTQLNQDPQIVEQAVEAVQRAVALNDSFWSTHLALGYVYLYQKQYERVVVEMERAVALDPFGALNSAALAEVLSRGSRADEALWAAAQALLQRAIGADYHLLSTGTAYALVGRYEEALALLKQYLTRYPDIIEAHLILAAVYSELNETAARWLAIA